MNEQRAALARIIDLGLSVAQLRLLGAIALELQRQGDETMAQLEGINEALSGLSDEITQVADQIAGLSADGVTQSDLDGIEAKIRDAGTRIDGLVETEGEDVLPGEPTGTEGTEGTETAR